VFYRTPAHGVQDVAVQRNRDDLLDASLAMLAAALHVAMASVVDRFPPELDLSIAFVVLPALLSAGAAVVLLLRPERRPLQVACVYTWLMVVFTLPAGLGLAWVPSAAVLTVAVLRPRLSSAPSAAG